MLKFAANLPKDREIAIVGWGQSNARPWGHRDREGFDEAPHLQLRPAGYDITVLSIDPVTPGQPHGAVGEQSIITVAEFFGTNDLVGATLRLVHLEFGDEPTGTQRAGFARVVANATVFTGSVFALQLTVEWLAPLEPDSQAAVTFSDAGGDLQVDAAAHGRSNGDAVRFWTDDLLPSTLSRRKTYYVVNANVNDYQVAETEGGTPIAFAGDAAGAHFFALADVAIENLAGYVHFNDRWKSYANVRVLMPYQPETPGDYPEGAPDIPGYDHPAEVDSYAKCGVFREFAWEEGVEGIGAVGDATGVSVDATSMTVAGAAWKVGMFDGAEVRCGNARATIGENSAGQLTGLEWIPAAPTGDLEWEIHVPHYRDNPNHSNPGKGFRYPANDMQPGGTSALSAGTTYNRPSGVLTRSYVGREAIFASVNQAINLSEVAETRATDGLWLSASLSGNKLRITTQNAGVSNPGTGAIQFEDFARVGHLVALGGWGGTVNGIEVTRTYRVTAMNPSDPGQSWIELEETNGDPITSVDVWPFVHRKTVFQHAIDNSVAFQNDDGEAVDHDLSVDDEVAFSITGCPAELTPGTTYYVRTVPASDRITVAATPGGAEIVFTSSPTGGEAFFLEQPATVTASKVTWIPAHRFGSMINMAWQLSTMLGRRVNVIHLGVNSSGQFLRSSNNAFGFQGQLGWWDDDQNLDWTPGNPTGNAARLQAMLEMAPHALTAEGNDKRLAIVGAYGFQGEAETLVEAGRELYHRSLPAFYRWLRKTIFDLGISAYDDLLELPFCHAKLPSFPWEAEGEFYGQTVVADTEGLVNQAIEQLTYRDPFGSTIETEDHPKLDGTTLFGEDPLHFNGVGEARNGEKVAGKLAVSINAALMQQDETGAVELCNQALKHLGHTVRIESLKDETPEAQACAEFFEMSRDTLLEMRNWSFAQDRTELVEVQNPVKYYQYAYAMPPNVARPRAVVPPGVTGDLRDVNPDDYPFAVEVDDDGYEVIYSDVKDAHLFFTLYMSDVSLMSDLFRLAWSWHLASLLAGPVVGGDEGIRRGENAARMVSRYLPPAQELDGRHRRVHPEHKATHLRKRH